MINDVWRNLLKVLQFISSCREDGEEIKAQDKHENNTADIIKLSSWTDVAEDEIKVVEIFHSFMTLLRILDEFASVSIRQPQDMRTRRLNSTSESFSSGLVYKVSQLKAGLRDLLTM